MCSMNKSWPRFVNTYLKAYICIYMYYTNLKQFWVCIINFTSTSPMSKCPTFKIYISIKITVTALLTCWHLHPKQTRFPDWFVQDATVVNNMQTVSYLPELYAKQVKQKVTITNSTWLTWFQYHYIYVCKPNEGRYSY